MDKKPKLTLVSSGEPAPSSDIPVLEESRPHKKGNEYYRIFEDVFPTMKIDILTGDLMVLEDNRWSSIFDQEQVECLKTYAIEAKLDRSAVKPYLHRYHKELKQLQGPELLANIPEWDGVDRLKSIAERIHSQYFDLSVIEEFIKEWYGRVFRRLENPKVDNFCLIFLGRQGIGKEVLIRALTNGLGQFIVPFQYQGQQKDILQALHSGVVVHIEEFDHISEKLSSSFLKMLITTSGTLFRAAYGKRQQHRQSRWSLIASCNRDDFLRDHTGNRRFVIIPIERIDGVLDGNKNAIRYPEGLIDYPVDDGKQILAQAKHLAAQQFGATTASRERMQSYIDQLTPHDPQLEFVTDFLRYVESIKDQLKLVKQYLFIPASEHQDQIIQLARRYKIRGGWNEIKDILQRHNVETDLRTQTHRGIGVSPEILDQPKEESGA